MEISSIIAKNNDIAIVRLDSGREFEVDINFVVSLELRKNLFIDEKLIEKLKEREQVVLIKNRALLLLARRAHSGKELEMKLSARGFSGFYLKSAIKELYQKGFINDEDFARLFLKEKLLVKKQGPLKAISALTSKGISRDTAEYLIKELIDDDAIFKNAIETARKKLKILKNKETETFRIKQKLFSFLSGRGYKTDTIQNVFNNLNL